MRPRISTLDDELPELGKATATFTPSISLHTLFPKKDTPMTAPPPRWIRYTKDEYCDVLFRHQTVRAVPGCWPFRPALLAEIRAQHPNISDAEFEESYWVCEGGCMLCGLPLKKNGSCSVRRRWFSLVPRDQRPHLTRLEELVMRVRFWFRQLVHGDAANIDGLC